MKGVKNYSIAVKRRGDDIKFLRKIVNGGADDSFGIEVAKLAGLPPKIISRAKKLLNDMEEQNEKNELAVKAATDNQISFYAIGESVIKSKLRETNIDEMDDAELREFVKELERYL
jgi:DNA mismatch repair protein MutS